MADRAADLLIIGAGIVGLATALEASRRFPDMQILVVEKENRVAAHQTGHNSGVIHSGLLQDRLAKGAQLRGGCCVYEALLRGAGRAIRGVRQTRCCYESGGGSEAGATAS